MNRKVRIASIRYARVAIRHPFGPNSARRLLFFDILRRMRFHSVLGACGLAVFVCFSATAQSAAPSGAGQKVSQQTPQGGVAPGAPPLQLQNLPPEQRTLTPAEQEQVKREQAYRAAMRVANLTARWGPAMSTPGVSVMLVETARAKNAAGATQFTYQIAGSGFRTGEKLNLVRWPLGGGMQTVMGGLVLNAQGIAVCGASAETAPGSSGGGQPAAPGVAANAAPAPGSAPPPPSCLSTMHPNQPVTIQATAAPGEPIRIALISADRTNGAATQAIPFPIANTDKSCSLQILLGVKDADMVVVEGAGFPPSSTVKIETITGAQDRNLNAKTDPGGKMAMVVLPAVAGQTTGTTTVRYGGVVAPVSKTAPAVAPPSAPSPAAADSGCSPAVTFSWGQGSYKPH